MRNFEGKRNSSAQKTYARRGGLPDGYTRMGRLFFYFATSGRLSLFAGRERLGRLRLGCNLLSFAFSRDGGLDQRQALPEIMKERFIKEVPDDLIPGWRRMTII